MGTPEQTASRLANLSHSHGPVTEEGKAASAMNALKFGFFARDPVIQGEKREEWDAFRDPLVASFEPANDKENVLANRIADAAWRLRRFAVVEAAMFSYQIRVDESIVYRDTAEASCRVGEYVGISPEDSNDPEKCQELLDLSAAAESASRDPDYTMGRAFIRDAKCHAAFAKLARYESSIERAMLRAIRELERLQAKRNRKVTRMPAARETAKLQNEPETGLTPVQTAA